MDPRRWKEIHVAFGELVELDAAERTRRLAVLGTTDPALREAVESLLAADAEADVRLAPIEAALLSPTPASTAASNERPPDHLRLAGHTVSHFRVLEPLGAGGMGVVYRAEDTRLGRAVALKFLLPLYSLDPAAKARFLHEAHSAAALDHPNLCTIHEIGEMDDGRLFLAMALYAGETLKARLAHEGPLPVGEALKIARQIAQALSCAHAAGIVHRDLKPGNVMLLPDGAVKVLDFGLAKAPDQSQSASSARFGTLAYMAPEQVRGNTADARTDLWALGVVLYEMLTGRNPFGGEHELAIARAILHHEALRPSAFRPDVPATVEDLVRRLLEKDPPKRYTAASDVLADLAAADPRGDSPIRPVRRRRLLRPRWLIAVASTLVLGALAYVAITRLSGDAGVEQISSVAVLPFEDLAGDSAQEYFADGTTDALITHLAQAEPLRVISRTSVMHYKRTTKPTAQIARELGVDAVVEGTLLREGGRIRVTAKLIHAATGRQLWTNSYDADMAGVLALQDQVGHAIASAVDARTRSGVGWASPPVHPEAYELYLRGRQAWNRRSREGLEGAVVFFRRATEADPGWALAHAGLADAYVILGYLGYLPTASAFPKGKAAAIRALELDSGVAEAYASQGMALSWERDWVGAERAFRRAIELRPGYATARQWYALLLIERARVPEALAQARQASELDPLSLQVNNTYGMLLYLGGDSAAALRQYQRIVDAEPDREWVEQNPWLLSNAARVYTVNGLYAEAKRLLDRALAINPRHPRPLADLAWLYIRMGEPERAIEALDRGDSQNGQYAFYRAAVHTALGQVDSAFYWLERVEEWAPPNVGELRTDPRLLPLRGDPRYTRLLARLGLP